MNILWFAVSDMIIIPMYLWFQHGRKPFSYTIAIQFLAKNDGFKVTMTLDFNYDIEWFN